MASNSSYLGRGSAGPVFVPELPHNATGKLMKPRLREMFRDHKLPDR